MVGRVLSHVKSNLVGYLALFVALGGTSYAAASLPKNSVGRAQLRKGAVTASKVKAHSLTRGDFKRGQLPRGAKGARGIQGVQGSPGSQGPQGLQGIPGSARAYGQIDIVSGNFSLVPGSSKNVIGVLQGGGGNPGACIELDPSIDASTASVIATPNLRSGSSANWNNTALQSQPLGYCGGIGTNVVEVDTSLSNSPGAAVKSAFDFMVP
jgi:hypothetical protein